MGLTELVEISRQYGRDPDFVLAGGGNTSYKDDRLLYVKASGTTLAELTAHGLVRMRRDRLDAIWDAKYASDPAEREAQALADLMNARVEGETKRPSVETLLHALLPEAYVVHTHPALVNGLTCGAQGESSARELLGDGVLWVPVTNPGYVLAARIREAIEKRVAGGRSRPSLILLQNHGIFVSNDSVDEIRRTYAGVMDRLQTRLRRRPDVQEGRAEREPESHALAGAFALEIEGESAAARGEAIFLSNSEIDLRVADRRAFEPISSFAYTPDHMVYCREAPVWVPFEATLDRQREALRDAMNGYRKKFGPPPRVAAFERRGIAVYGENRASLESARALFIDLLRVVRYAESFGGPQPMPEAQVAFIRDWEVEKYRADVNSGRSE